MDNKNIKVLVVDDESDFRQLMKFWLESKGYLVTVVPNGKSAVEQVKEEKLDIIFMDLRMPVMDGVETIRRIRRFDKDIPIIIISAYVDDPRVKDATSYGVSGVFCKGKNFEEGLSLLESALRTHKKLKK